MNTSVQMPWYKALAWIFISTLIISGSFGVGLLYWKHHKIKRATDPRYTIVAIMQECDSNEPLQTNYLAALLGLSLDQPTNLFSLNTKEAVQKLLEVPIITSAEVKKILPAMIYVKYSQCKPVAYIADYTNAAIDENGLLIPAKPFYTPKNIPELYLGLPNGLSWGTSVLNEKTVFALKVLNRVNLTSFPNSCRLRRIDVSKAFSKSYGEREFVLFFEACIDFNSENTLQHIIIRFSPDNWLYQMQKYLSLHERIVKGLYKSFSKDQNRTLVDMRISQLAFIGESI